MRSTFAVASCVSFWWLKPHSWSFLIILDGSYVMIHIWSHIWSLIYIYIYILIYDLIYPNVCCFNPCFFFLSKASPKTSPKLSAGPWSAPPAAGRLAPGRTALWTAGRSRGRWGKRSGRIMKYWLSNMLRVYIYIYIIIHIYIYMYININIYIYMQV